MLPTVFVELNVTFIGLNATQSRFMSNLIFLAAFSSEEGSRGSVVESMAVGRDPLEREEGSLMGLGWNWKGVKKEFVWRLSQHYFCFVGKRSVR